MIDDKKKSRVEHLMLAIQNHKVLAVVIFIGIVIIGLSKFLDAGEGILRQVGIIKTFNTNQVTERGKFSANLLENAWNRMFWMRVYTERIRLNTGVDEQRTAWEKYLSATEKWSSNIMNYYLGLEEYYPKTDKRRILERKIQPKFAHAGRIVSHLKYSADSAERLVLVDSIQKLVGEINIDFYSLIDQPPTK